MKKKHDLDNMKKLDNVVVNELREQMIQPAPNLVLTWQIEYSICDSDGTSLYTMTFTHDVSKKPGIETMTLADRMDLAGTLAVQHAKGKFGKN